MHSKLCSPTRCSKSKALFSKETSVKQAKCFELRRRLVHGPAARSRKRPKHSPPKQSKRISQNLSALHELDTRFQLLGGSAFNSWEDKFYPILPQMDYIRHYQQPDASGWGFYLIVGTTSRLWENSIRMVILHKAYQIKHICNLLKYCNRITPYLRRRFIDFPWLLCGGYI